jgi:hypothetical protein
MVMKLLNQSTNVPCDHCNENELKPQNNERPKSNSVKLKCSSKSISTQYRGVRKKKKTQTDQTKMSDASTQTPKETDPLQDHKTYEYRTEDNSTRARSEMYVKSSKTRSTVPEEL